MRTSTALLLLDALGHSYHTGLLIDRSVFEDTATATWISDDPDEREARFIRLVQDRNYHLTKLAEHDPEGWGEVLDRERSVDERGRTGGVVQGQTSAARAAPHRGNEELVRTIPALVPVPASQHRKGTRRLSRDRRRDDGTSRGRVRPRVTSRSQQRSSGVSPWVLEFDWSDQPDRTGLGFRIEPDEFRQLGLVLNTFTRSEPVTADTLVYIPRPEDYGTK